MSLSRTRLSEPAEPQPLLSLSTAPLAAVVLSLLAVWAVALPNAEHTVALKIESGCHGIVPPEQTRAIHTVAIAADGSLSWDSQPLANRAALHARMQAVGDVSAAEQDEVYVQPHRLADYGAVITVMASAQRHGVRFMGITGDEAAGFPTVYPITGPYPID